MSIGAVVFAIGVAVGGEFVGGRVGGPVGAVVLGLAIDVVVAYELRINTRGPALGDEPGPLTRRHT